MILLEISGLPSKLVGAGGKVGLRDKGYEWVSKSEFFVEFPKKKKRKKRVSPTLAISCLVAM